jgi:hypothetical protein
MNRISSTTLAFVLLIAAGSAFAGSCPREMKAIDKAMASASLSMEDMERVKALRAKGEKLHRSGSHSDSIDALNEAKDILGI